MDLPIGLAYWMLEGELVLLPEVKEIWDKKV